MTIKGWLAQTLFREEIRGAVRRALAVETESSFTLGAHAWNGFERDRLPGDREEILRQALEAWRANPMARRIVGLTTQYVVGGGVSLRCPHASTAAFLNRFWNHPLNGMGLRLHEWCDELTRTGNLFLLVSTDAGGMSYVRTVPAGQVREIRSAPNDVEREVAFALREDDLGERILPAFDALQDAPGESGAYQPVMLHYAVNRPAGAQWGESDLAPYLRWISRYSAWLEDRARLNRFRTAFLYVVKARFSSEAERLSRQNALNARPPSPGSILVTDETESWDVLSPKLDSNDAATDGLALKKMIASGAGIPLHFLAEPEGTNRTTAEAAGGPTYRHFQQRQQVFLWMVADLLRVVVRRRAAVDRLVDVNCEISVSGADISTRDNLELARASAAILPVLRELRERGLVDDAEFLRLVYRFCGEAG